MKKAFIILLFFFTACKKHKEQPITFTDFPNEIGDHWRYRYQHFSGSTYYLDIDIIGTRILPDGQSAKVWLLNSNLYGTDTNFVVFDGQVAKVYGDIYGSVHPPYYEIMHHSFPLQVGTVYAYPVPFYRDTSKVLENSPLTVPAGTFNNTFKISKTREYIVNSLTRDTVWFSPTVGMTKWVVGEYDLGPVGFNGIWELTEYKLH